MMQVLLDILEWSTQLPDWQRDALRRAVTQHETTEADIDELLTLLKATKGALPEGQVAPAARPFSSIDVGTRPDEASPVRLESLHDLDNVNALARAQRLSFEEVGLTVIYGENASGKSGYARVLKRACRARGEEAVLSDVTRQSGEPPRASFDIRRGKDRLTVSWEEGQQTADELAEIAVFDTRCARITVCEANKLNYVPYGLDVLPELAKTMTRIAERLKTELTDLRRSPAPLPTFAPNTSVAKLVASLSLPLDTPKAVGELEKLSNLTPTESARLAELQQLADILRSSDPAVEVAALRRQSSRVLTLAEVLERWGGRISDSALAESSGLKTSSDKVAVAEAAAQRLTSAVISGSQLPGVGGAAWKDMIATAVNYLAIEFEAERRATITSPGGMCPLCQQVLSEEAAKRLHGYFEFIEAAVSAEAKRLRGDFDADRRKLVEDGAPSAQIAIETIDEVAALDAGVAQVLASHLGALDQRATQVTQACSDGLWDGVTGLPPSPAPQLRELAAAIEATATSLEQNSDPQQRAATLAEYDELLTRRQLVEQMAVVRARIIQLQLEAALLDCLSATDTTAVSRRSSRLTQDAITVELEKAVQSELAKLGNKDLQVNLKRTISSGMPLHSLQMSQACDPRAKVDSVLSEGEHRVLAIAAFLAELSLTSPSCSIVLDDPVCSLDHVYREKVAQRLAEEAQSRQVIIFTHDLVFLLALSSQADGRCNMVTHTVRKGPEGAGTCDPNALPWAAMNVKRRLGVLHALHQDARAIYRGGDLPAYRRAAGELYGLLRETWERAVEEVLLNDAVQRMRPEIKTLSLRGVIVEQEDCKKIENGMTRCSTYLVGHDAPAAGSDPMPDPEEVAADIAVLADFRSSINSRRVGVKHV